MRGATRELREIVLLCVCAEAEVKNAIYIDPFPCLEERTTQEIIAQKIAGCREEVWDRSGFNVYVCPFAHAYVNKQTHHDTMCVNTPR